MEGLIAGLLLFLFLALVVLVALPFAEGKPTFQEIREQVSLLFNPRVRRERRETRRREVRDAIEGIIKQHLHTLARKRRLLAPLVDDYGTPKESSAWEDELAYFLSTAVFPKVAAVAGTEHVHPDDYEWSTKQIEALLAQQSATTDFTSVETPNLEPTEFEELCAETLRRNGWNAHRTQATGDQGVDVVAEKDGLRIVLQCKLYSQPVGNSAVQEVEAGKTFYGASSACVVSNASFTRSARQLANLTGTFLLHHSELSTLEERIRDKS